jgi:hypothetical protein
MDDRMIDTTMSSRIIGGLLKKGWTIRRLAKTLDAPTRFIEGVRSKKHVLTINDIKSLAHADRQSTNMMILSSLEPAKPEFRELIDATRHLLQSSESPIPHAQRKNTSRKRRIRDKAA